MNEQPKWHDDIEALSNGGVEEVRRHPASHAELRLVATIDHIRVEGRRYETALVELAAACEFTVEGMRSSTRLRGALDAAWEVCDPDHSIRDREALKAGCSP